MNKYEKALRNVRELEQMHSGSDINSEVLEELVELKKCETAYVKQNYYVPPKTIIQTPNTDILFKLVERATPEKPTVKLVEAYCGEIPSEKEFHYFCPMCGMFVGCETETQPFCSECGQAIDWNDEDEVSN